MRSHWGSWRIIATRSEPCFAKISLEVVWDEPDIDTYTSLYRSVLPLSQSMECPLAYSHSTPVVVWWFNLANGSISAPWITVIGSGRGTQFKLGQWDCLLRLWVEVLEKTRPLFPHPTGITNVVLCKPEAYGDQESLSENEVNREQNRDNRQRESMTNGFIWVPEESFLRVMHLWISNHTRSDPIAFPFDMVFSCFVIKWFPT